MLAFAGDLALERIVLDDSTRRTGRARKMRASTPSQQAVCIADCSAECIKCWVCGCRGWDKLRRWSLRKTKCDRLGHPQIFVDRADNPATSRREPSRPLGALIFPPAETLPLRTDESDVRFTTTRAGCAIGRPQPQWDSPGPSSDSRPVAVRRRPADDPQTTPESTPSSPVTTDRVDRSITPRRIS